MKESDENKTDVRKIIAAINMTLDGVFDHTAGRAARTVRGDQDVLVKSGAEKNYNCIRQRIYLLHLRPFKISTKGCYF